MQLDSQSETIAFLTNPATHAAGMGAGTGPVEVIETHISVVVLAGARAYKLKRAVDLPYVDFSSAERRLAMCEREVELNRRAVPDLYLGVRRITRTADGSLAFGGDGPLVDAVVEMVRFDQEGLFDRMAGRGLLTPPLLTELAAIVARLHEAAPAELAGGGANNIAAVLSINESALDAHPLFPAQDVALFNRAFRRALDRAAPLLDRRGRLGKVRHCHGDLHLGNICLFEGHPAPFDCIEFNDAMATVDVLYDLAFLLMDLWHRGLKPGANLVLNRYLDALDESDGVPLAPLLMAIRAAVRAHVSAARADDPREAGNAAELRKEAVAYFNLAQMLLRPVPPRLVAIGGFSGAGKSTIAAAIAEAVGPSPGARVLSSDRIRKRMGGVTPTTPLPAPAYRREVSQAVYETLGREAEYLLALGHGVVLDATFRRAEQRAHVEEIATAVGVPFTGIWLELAEGKLIERLAGRGADPSDATADVVRHQISQFRGPVTWHAVSAEGSVDAVVGRVLALIGSR
jgi:aminoglycoside phosphotransferase family enzyme/predicted kinase